MIDVAATNTLTMTQAATATLDKNPVGIDLVVGNPY